MSKNTFTFRYFAVSLVLVSILGTARIAYSSTGQFIANNTPPFVRTATKIGPADPSQTIEITVWLNVHNRQQLDSVAEDLYDPSSSHYRDWLSFSEIAADFGPTAQEANAVKEFLSAHHLSITLTDPNNFFVQAQGTIAQVSAAFRIHMSNFKVNGKVIRANTTDPYIEGGAAPFVHLVSGLSNQQSEVIPIQRDSSSGSGSTLPSVAAQSPLTLGTYFTSDCFTGTTTDILTTNGGLPAATYTGNSYGGTSVGGCGYTPPEIQTAYNLSALYNEGYDGTGQTIVIFEICNTATIKSDANAFSKQFGLPPLTKENFSVIGYPVAAPCDYPDVEESLDVEWAHAIAPGANIVVLVTPNIVTDSGFAQDIDVALLYAVSNNLGNVISFSYGTPEIFLAPADLDETNLLTELAAVSGISANFSSGDAGDYTEFGIPATVLYPASTQYGTAVGGISLALNSSNAIEWQSGWGTNTNVLDSSGLVSDPPTPGSFFGGSGGGPSAFFSKPAFQNQLPGSFRLLPDISWLADPFTGVVVDLTENGVYPPREWFAIGGTSVACPMFSALWAIANEEAGIPLGQAARYVYSMPSSTITDIVPVGSSTNVTGTVTDASGTTSYSASELAAPLDGITVFYDALWNEPLNEGTVELVTFGTDTHLETAPGWDDVTGMGVPNPKAFADFFHPAK